MMETKANIPKTKLKYRFMQGHLDKIGIITNIDQVGKKHFVFYKNGEAIISRKTRKTCNKYIEKLYLENEKSLECNRLD